MLRVTITTQTDIFLIMPQDKSPIRKGAKRNVRLCEKALFLLSVILNEVKELHF